MLDPRAFLINSKTGRVVASTFVEFLSGNSTNPSICFTDSPDSGLQCDSSGAVNYIKNGTNLGELAAGSSSVGGSDTQIQFNDSGIFAGSADLTWDNTGKELSVVGDLNAGSFIPTGSTVPTNGIYRPGADQIAISTNSAERLRIDSSGRVGIGTTSPARQLHVAGEAVVFNTNQFLISPTTDNVRLYARDSSTGPQNLSFNIGITERLRIDSSGRLLIGTSTSADLGSSMQTAQTSGTGAFEAFQFSNSAAYPYITFAKSRGASVGTNAIVQNGDPLGEIVFRGANGTGYNTAASITASVDAVPGASNDMPGRLVFSVTRDGSSSPTEAIRIASDGRSDFFADSNVVQMVATTKAGSITDYLLIGRHSSTGYNTGTSCIVILSNGNINNTNNSYGALSDIKLKENIVDANSQWDDLKALQVRNYNFKEGQTHTQIGLIAQEVELVSPGLVSESPDLDEEGNDLGTVTKSVNYSVLYVKAVKALQEAMERIETLEAKVAALESA